VHTYRGKRRVVGVLVLAVMLSSATMGVTYVRVPRESADPRAVITASPGATALARPSATANPGELTATVVPATATGEVQPTPTAQTMIRQIDGAPMVFIPAGEFLMGAADDDPFANIDEKPRHAVFLDAFWIDKYEVTNAQYKMCVVAGACLPSSGYGDDSQYNGDRQPVVGVSWDDAVAYCRWVGGRLPTEAEWEKAARGTDGRIYPWGNDWDPRKVNSEEGGLGRTADVGSYPDGASPYGALDMAGNVWEWVADWFVRPYPSGRQVNPTGPAKGGDKVLRGGYWGDLQFNVRTTARFGDDPIAHGNAIGFRPVVSPGRGG
jgi:eukaryotic-like serine/threonine-protein kinase